VLCALTAADCCSPRHVGLYQIIVGGVNADWTEGVDEPEQTAYKQAD